MIRKVRDQLQPMYSIHPIQQTLIQTGAALNRKINEWFESARKSNTSTSFREVPNIRYS